LFIAVEVKKKESEKALKVQWWSWLCWLYMNFVT